MTREFAPQALSGAQVKQRCAERRGKRRKGERAFERGNQPRGRRQACHIGDKGLAVIMFHRKRLNSCGLSLVRS